MIRGGANVMAESNNGKTALDLSQEEKQSGCVDILQAAVSKVCFGRSHSSSSKCVHKLSIFANPIYMYNYVKHLIVIRFAVVIVYTC